MDCQPLWQQSLTPVATLEVGVETTLVGAITLEEMVGPALGAITPGGMVAPVLGVLMLAEEVGGKHLEEGPC